MGSGLPRLYFNGVQLGKQLPLSQFVPLVGIELFQNAGDLGTHYNGHSGLHRARSVDFTPDLLLFNYYYSRWREIPENFISRKRQDEEGYKNARNFFLT